MEFSYEFYPPFWKKKGWRKQVLAAAGNRCQVCHEANRTVGTNADGEPFMRYLQIAHKQQYLTWYPEAETMVLCQQCHREFDRVNNKRDKTDFTFTPIGQARISAIYKRHSYPVGLVTSYHELRAIIDAQSAGTVLVIHLEFNLTVVGRGKYVKTHAGVEVVRETGAARNLWMAFNRRGTALHNRLLYA